MGIDAHNEAPVFREIKIDLKGLGSNNEVKELKKVKNSNAKIRRSNSELELMKQIQPACHAGDEIACGYTL